MKTRNERTDPATIDVEAPRLPLAPDLIYDDRVNDLGWLSRGPSRRADRAAASALRTLLLRDGEESGLPPDPDGSPPLR